MTRLLFVLLMAAGTAWAQPRAGETEEQFEIRLRSLYSEPCNKAGFKPFTDPHNQCIVVLYQRDQEAEKKRGWAALAKQAEEREATQRANGAQLLNSIKPRPQVTCITSGSLTTCQ